MEEPDDTEQIEVIPMEMVFLVVKKEIEDQTPEHGDQSGCEYTLKPVSVTEPKGEVAVQWNEIKCEYISQPVLGDKLQDTNVSDANGLESFCEACGLSFVTTSSYKNHKKSCHGKPNLKDGVASDLQSFVKLVDGRKFFSCDVCQYETNRKFNFKKHLATHARNNPSERNIHHSKEFKHVVNIKEEFISDPKSLNSSCEVIGSTSTFSYENQKVLSQGGASQKQQIYICTDCQYKTTKRSSFKNHLASYAHAVLAAQAAANAAFDREQSDVSFVEPRQLTSHDSTEVYNCTKCEASFKSSLCLEKHVLTHAKDKKFKCDVCSKGFNNSSNLSRHKRWHSGYKPFKCSMCSYASSTSGNLKAHMRRSHSDKPLTLLACDKCEYKSAERSNLKKHQMTHLDTKPALFPCEFCEFKAALKHHLTQHMSVHSGAKPFACNLCEYKAAREAHLKRHTLSVHQRVKSLSCILCKTYKTSDKSNLTKHMKSKHSVIVKSF